MAKRKRQPPPPSEERIRAEIRDFLDEELGEEEETAGLVDLLEEMIDLWGNASVGRHLAWLCGRDPEERIRNGARWLLTSAVGEHNVPPADEQVLRREALPVLQEMIRDPNLPDDEKLQIGAMFMALGGEMPDDEYRSCFKDLDAAMRKSLQTLEEQLSDDPQQLDETVRMMQILREDERPPEPHEVEVAAAVAAAFAFRRPAAATALVCAIAAIAAQHRLPPEPLLEPLEVCGGHPDERSAWYLAELGRWPATGALGAKAAALAEQQIAGGVRPRCTMLRDFSHGHVSMVDGVGSRTVILFFRTPEGGMDGVVLMLNDTVGMKDAWCAFEDSSELDKGIHGGVGDLAYAPCSLQLARDLVANAWHIQLGLDRPFPGSFSICRPYLGEEAIEPKGRKPDLGAYMMELMVPSPLLARDSDGLVEYGPYGGLWFGSDPAYAFVKAHMPKRGGKLKKPEFEQFLREIAPLEREQLLSRMALNLELESLAGRATQELNQTAAKTYLAMGENTVPMHEVPYVRALAERAIERIIQNLRAGFRNQAEANQASLEADDVIADLMDEFLNNFGAPGRR